MDPSGKMYLFLPTTKDVWEVVRETYLDLENSTQIFELKTKLWWLKQGEREVTKYYNAMKGLWQELDLCFEEEWDCPTNSVRHMKRVENDGVFVFLESLNKNLDKVKRQNFR